HPSERDTVRGPEDLAERLEPVLDHADRGIDRRRDDLVGAVRVAREREGERDVAGRSQPAVHAEREDLALLNEQKRDRGAEDRPGETEVAAAGLAVEAEAEPVGRDEQA